jgi:hypothetical protein
MITARNFIFLLLLVLPVQVAFAEGNLVYHLLSDHKSADLDYALLERLIRQERLYVEQLQQMSEEDPEKPVKRNPIFNVGSKDIEPLLTVPKKGKFRILTFCALKIGPMHEGEEAIAHHLLVLKTDSQQRIVDGFYFIHEWADPSSLPYLLRIKNKTLHLKRNLEFQMDDFATLNGTPSNHFNPTGRIDNLLGLKIAF